MVRWRIKVKIFRIDTPGSVWAPYNMTATSFRTGRGGVMQADIVGKCAHKPRRSWCPQLGRIPLGTSADLWSC